MKTKIICILLVCSVLLSLAGCASGKPATPPQSASVEEQQESPAEQESQYTSVDLMQSVEPIDKEPAPITPSPDLPRVTKNPGSETVYVNGTCQFITRYENAELAEWHFVSPDGLRDLDYAQMQDEMPALRIRNGFSKDLTLENVPKELNGWRVYCLFTNGAGSVATETALITVR